MSEHSREYFIDNPSCAAPFSIEVYKEVELGGYTVDMRIFGKVYTRIFDKRLDAIIIAKEMGRALEDAFRHTYEDRSSIDDNSK